MKLARLDDGKRHFWAVIDTEKAVARELSGTILDWGADLTNGKIASPPATGRECPLTGLRFLPPIEPVSKIAAVGANYQKHLDELGLKKPERIVAFLKPYSALIGHDQEVPYPAVTNQLDYEVELVAVIGAPAIDRGTPSNSILGYTIGNDVSARDLQKSPLGGMDLFSAKIHDRTAGLGPWIVTCDELGGRTPDLAIGLAIDGEVRQDDRTSAMIWGADEILLYVDDRTSLTTGDVVYTGTPAGVALANGRYLKPGEAMDATIEKIGVLRNTVGARRVR